MDQTAIFAVVQKPTRAASLMSAPEVLDTVTASPEFAWEQSDAPQAYMQTDLRGNDAWVELPVDRWLPEGKRMRRPLVKTAFRPLWTPIVGSVLGTSLLQELAGVRI